MLTVIGLVGCVLIWIAIQKRINRWAEYQDKLMSEVLLLPLT